MRLRITLFDYSGLAVTKSELIEVLARKQPHLPLKDVELAVRCVVDHLSDTLASGERIEIRGFGSFSLHHRDARLGRNPKTGESVSLTEKHVPHFKPGKELRDMVDASREKFKIVD
jgi:integration host factor subunit beta